MKEATIKSILSEELFGNRICESIEDQEIVDFFYNEFLLEKFLWGEPISVPELRKLLRKKIVNFEFIKLDGHIRPAKGTTMMKYIPVEDHPKGIRPSSDQVATFFDMDKDAWRSVSKKSKEIVLKKDEETDKPIIVVKDKEDQARKTGKDIDKSGPEPTDELQVGDLRNYLNRNGKNILIKITRVDDDGSVYAETFREKTPFKIPGPRVQNIGEIATPEEIKAVQLRSKPIQKPPVRPAPSISTPTAPPPQPGKEMEEPELKPVTPETPEGDQEREVIQLIPQKDTPAKDPPEEVDDKEDAEELIK
jgi:hypothetical protein